MSNSPAHAFVTAHADALRALCDAIVPSDDYPSATESGSLRLLGMILTEKPEWLPRIDSVLVSSAQASETLFGQPLVELAPADRSTVIDSLAGDTAYDWFVWLVHGGYYADPGNGGNDGAASWVMLDWSGAPRGGWPPLQEHRPSSRVEVDPGALSDRYDAIVIGSGAGGGVAACGLAESGRSVLVIEAGSWPSTETLAIDHLHNPRSFWNIEARSGPSDDGNPRVVETTAGSIVLDPSDLRWSNNASTVGGGTRVYGAQAWRFGPDDFAMATRYGVPDCSALADWPFGFDELEPYYARAEAEVGVRGDSTDGAHAGPRSQPHPMPPLPAGRARELLQSGAERLGFSTLSAPLLINSTPFLGRGACVQCAMCVGFACRLDAKNNSVNTMLERAFATGRCSILTDARAERPLTDRSGRVVAVAVAGLRDGVVWRRKIAASEFVVAADAVESARPLLNSANDREPGGIGNNTDHVGRYLQAHVQLGALGLFDDAVEELIGPGPSIATSDFRQGNEGIVGGGIIVNEFPLAPTNTYRKLVEAGLIPQQGLAAKRGMRKLNRRMLTLYAPIQEVTTAGSRVRIDPAVTDRLGIPVARLSGNLHPEDIRTRDFLADRAEDWLRASGATTIAALPRSVPSGPSGGHHQAGTCRMGSDPSASVTDPWGRVWGHDNLRIADGSLHVTNGGVNPVLTIFANAMRIIQDMAGGWNSRQHAIARDTETADIGRLA